MIDVVVVGMVRVRLFHTPVLSWVFVYKFRTSGWNFSLDINLISHIPNIIVKGAQVIRAGSSVILSFFIILQHTNGLQ